MFRGRRSRGTDAAPTVARRAVLDRSSCHQRRRAPGVPERVCHRRDGGNGRSRGLWRVLRDRSSGPGPTMARDRWPPRARSVRRAVVRGRGHNDVASADTHPRARVPQSTVDGQEHAVARRALERSPHVGCRRGVSAQRVQQSRRRLRRTQRPHRRSDHRALASLRRRRLRVRRPTLPVTGHHVAAPTCAATACASPAS